jgi:uncharacterized protein (DUF58 family)
MAVPLWWTRLISQRQQRWALVLMGLALWLVLVLDAVAALPVSVQ